MILKAKSILNWTPKIDRKKGLELTLDYFKSIKNPNFEFRDFSSYIKK